MAAASTDLFKKLANNFSTTLNGAIVGNGDTSMSLSSTTNLATDTGIVLVIDRVNSSGTLTPTLREYVVGTVSGSTVISLQRGVGNSTAQAHLSGAIVEQVVDQNTINDIVTGIRVHANQDGTLITSAVQNALGLSNLSGYTPVGFAPATVTANGNRSYSMVFNGQDLTSFLSPGMRTRTTRTVAAPTQSTSLNGTTQSFSKTAPAGMTFTDNFTCAAWVKLSSYPSGAGVIISRGVSGGATGLWQMYVTSAGQIIIQGASNAGVSTSVKTYTTYQSLPLNKWVHVAATLNMAGSVSATYIDGVSVPNSLSAGQTGTALAQTGSLYVGANADGNFFPGKIAQAAVFSAVLSQATIQGMMSQGLAGTETSLISAYSFNNSINDLNTTNANNLTANGSAVATAADSPFGGQANGTISSTLDYGIVQSATFSTNTTLVVQVPEGCTIPTSGGVSTVVYSSNAVPYGFPKQKGKWQVQLLGRTDDTGAVIANQSYLLPCGTINIPVGEWSMSFKAVAYNARTASSVGVAYITLSTSSTVGTDSRFNTAHYHSSNVSTIGQITTISFSNISLSLATATPYYLLKNSQSADSAAGLRGDIADTILIAENAYL